MNLIVFNEFGDNPVIGDAFFVFDEYERNSVRTLAQRKADSLEEEDIREDRYRAIKAEPADEKNGTWRGRPIPHWDEIKDVIYRLCVFVPQLEFFGAEIVINSDGFKITALSNQPDYPTCIPFKKGCPKERSFRKGRKTNQQGRQEG